VIDEEEEGRWLRFLCAVDGTRDLGTILAEIGSDLGELEGLLAEALEAGLLELTVPALRPVSS